MGLTRYLPSGPALAFLGTGVSGTILEQLLVYQGLTDARSMVLPLFNYGGMALGGLWGMCSSAAVTADVTPITPQPSENRAVYLGAGFELVGYCLALVGLTLAGSGLFQVLYASVVCWAALFGWLWMGKALSRTHWIGIFTVCVGLGASALGSSATSSSDTSSVVLGCFLTVAGAAVYGAYYVVSERFMMSNMSPPKLCARIGSILTILIFMYTAVVTAPHWQEYVVDPMAAVGGDTTIVTLCLLGFMFTRMAHNILYFQLISSSGAVSTGLIQAVRAITVFGLSSVMFCHSHPTQCFTWGRGLSTALVAAGVVLYTVATKPILIPPSKADFLDRDLAMVTSPAKAESKRRNFTGQSLPVEAVAPEP